MRPGFIAIVLLLSTLLSCRDSNTKTGDSKPSGNDTTSRDSIQYVGPMNHIKDTTGRLNFLATLLEKELAARNNVSLFDTSFLVNGMISNFQFEKGKLFSGNGEYAVAINMKEEK